MFVGNSDTAAPISTSPARTLENVRARMGRILEHSGSGPNKETRAVLDRLETEREAWQQAADEETVGGGSTSSACSRCTAPYRRPRRS